MTRNLKALGLALFAAFALSAVVASAASATDLFTVPSADTTLSATGKNSVKLKITSPLQGIECEVEKYSATTSSTASSSVTITPVYEKCTSESLGGVTVDMNGCDYVLTGETTGEDPKPGIKNDATVSLVCPAGKVIQLTAAFGCTFSIHEQTPTEGGATYTNEPAGKVTIHITATGITYSSNFSCQVAGFGAEPNNADLTGTVVVQGNTGNISVS